MNTKILNLNLKVDESTEKMLTEKASSLGMTLEDYISHTLDKACNSVVKFENGIYYDLHIGKLYQTIQNVDHEIELTRLEKRLFELLLNTAGEPVSLEDIHSVVWKGKNMSRFTLRNVINKLRGKTYYALLKNHSNIGYSLQKVA